MARTRSSQAGFTLIELIIVIIILGILAATAMPKFIDLSGDAAQAAVDGVAGGLTSAAAINYAARKVNGTKGVPVGNCTNVANAMETFNATNFTITASTVPADTIVTCTVSGATGSKYAGKSQTFTAIGIL